MINKDAIIEQLKARIADFKSEIKTQTVGKVIEIGDGIAKVSVLSDVMMSEMLEITNSRESEIVNGRELGAGKNESEKIYGVALNLEEDSVGVIILGDYKKIKEGDEVLSLKKILEVPVGEGIIGRVVNALGQPVDGKGNIKSDKFYPVEKIAPGVMTRESVSQPVQTGIKSIDAMIPVGRGQRELIIGDRQIGKTAIAIDTIINQTGQNLISIYVAIGHKASK